MAKTISLGLVAATLLGFALGCIPVVRDLVHLSAWVVLPVGSIALGALSGCLLFLSGRLSQRMIGGPVAIVAGGLCGVAALFASDLGAYLSVTVTLDGTEHHVSDLVSFVEFFKLQMGSTTLSSHGHKIVELGEVAGTLNVLADYVGAPLGGFLGLKSLTGTSPYCQKCRRFMKKVGAHTFRFAPGDDVSRNAFVEQLVGAITDHSSERLTSCVGHPRWAKTPAHTPGAPGAVSIEFTRHDCESCRDIDTLLITSMFDGKRWQELDGACYQYVFQPRD